jgi:hypothetical protein
MAYDLPSDETHTRLVTGLDGIDYLVALEGWFWNSLDWIHNNTDWHDTDFINLAWKAARAMENDGTMTHPGNFPAEFSLAFKASIWAHMVNLISAENGAANNSF